MQLLTFRTCAGAVLPLLIRLLAAFAALSIPIAALDFSLYSWHPTFMALGFLGFMAEAVLTAARFRPLDGSARTAGVQRHMWWQIAAVSSVLLGFTAIEANKVPACCQERLPCKADHSRQVGIGARLRAAYIL